MRVDQLTTADGPWGVERSARVRWDGGEFHLRFGGPPSLVSPGPDASLYVAALLLPAMSRGEDLEIDGPVSPRLLAAVPRLGAYHQQMNPAWRPVAVTAAASEPPPGPRASGVGCFFSRGVDSMYSAIAPRPHPAPLTALVHCDTLASGQDDTVRALELKLAEQAADQVGLPLHRIGTNLRLLTDQWLGWSDMHGGGLAALALLCSQGFGHMALPGAYDAFAMSPVGSHPLLDPLFGTEVIDLEHDGMEATRQAKVQWLVDHRPDLLPLLKVCFAENRPDNCGRCRKCLMTMVALQAAGGLRLASQFPPTVDLDAVRAVRYADVGLRFFWVQTLHDLQRTGADPALADALGHMLHRSARPSVREVLARRRAERAGEAAAFNPEATVTMERMAGNWSNQLLSVVRRGEVLPESSLTAPPPLPRATLADVAVAVVESAEHRLARLRRRR